MKAQARPAPSNATCFPHAGHAMNTILNAKGDSLRRRWEGNFAGASAPLVLNVLLDHLQRCSAARARKVRA